MDERTTETVSQRELDKQHAWLSLMTRDSNVRLWTYDAPSDTVSVTVFDELGIAHECASRNTPAQIVESASVHPGSRVALRDFFEDMRAGRAHDRTNLLLRSSSNGEYSWYEISYQMRFDDEGEPAYAVGIRREVDTFDEAMRWQRLVPDCLLPNLLKAGVASLASGRVDSLAVRPGGEIELLRETTLDQLSDKCTQLLPVPRERRAIQRMLDPKRLEQRYAEGRRWSVERIHVLVDGTAHPARVAVNVRRNTLGSLTALIYTSLCDQRASWEAATDASVMRDNDTQLYQRGYARLLVQANAPTQHGQSVSALSVIRAFEPEAVPRCLMFDLATAIDVFLDTDCFAYSYDEHSIGVYFPTLDSEDDARRRLDAAISAARASLTDAGPLDDIRLVTETIYAPSELLRPTEAADAARLICEQHGQGAGDMIRPPVPQQPSPGDEKSVADRTEADPRHLGEADLRAFASISSAMLGARSPQRAIDAALRGVGAYYGARRVYVAVVSHKDHLITVPFEWTSPSTVSIKGRLSDRRSSRFPFITHNINAPEPVFVSRPRLFTRSGIEERAADPWRFCLIPIQRGEDRSLALCIEGPARRFDSWDLARCVGSHIFRGHRPLCVGHDHMSDAPGDELAQMPGVHELEELLDGPRARAWSTVGALVVNIPNVSELVASRGLTHTLQAFLDIRDTLGQHFSPLPVYHTADTEFVALSPNATYRHFVRSCAQVRTSLVSSWPHELRLGSSWSDDVGSVWETLCEARAVAQHGKGSLNQDTPSGPTPSAGTALTGRSSDLGHRFAVYLQPKIDSRTGRLLGAEALARLVKPDGTTGSPAREIERLEKSGEVSTLDYFVFDAALSLMSRWRKRGYADLIVSSNFSRTTLLSPTSLASVLAIMSRYPEVPAANVEMEVTETAIDLGKTTLNELVSRYQGLGARVALDDFGSHYSTISALANVHFDTIKLDRSLVSGVPDNAVSCSFVKSITDICAREGISCVAEGVESAEQAAALAQEGCYCCQGFYFEKPMPPELFERKYLHVCA